MGSKVAIGILSLAILGMLYVYGVVIARAVNENGILALFNLAQNTSPVEQILDAIADVVDDAGDDAQLSQNAQEQAVPDNNIGFADNSTPYDLQYDESGRPIIDVSITISGADKALEEAQNEIGLMRELKLEAAYNLFGGIMTQLEVLGLSDTPEYQHCVDMQLFISQLS